MPQTFFGAPYKRKLTVIALLGGSLASPLFPLHAYDGIAIKKIISAPKSAKTFTPAGVDFDPSGRIWVTDPGDNAVMIFSAAGDWLQTVGRHGALVGQWDSPHGIAVDSQGNAYIADGGNHRIQVVSPEGKVILAFGSKGSLPGQMDRPWAVAVSHDGVVAVSEKDESEVHFYSHDGIYLQSFTTGAPIDAIALDALGQVYTLQTDVKAVTVWSSSGQKLKTVRGEEPGVRGFIKPKDIQVSSKGYLYVADSGAGGFRELDASGHTESLFGRSGSGEGRFRSLDGISVWNDNVAIADSKNRRVTLLAMARQTPLRNMDTAPTFKFDVERRGSSPLEADHLLWTSAKGLQALSTRRATLTNWDVSASTGTTVDLRKIYGIKTPAAMARCSGATFISDTAGNRVVKVSGDGKAQDVGKASGFFKSGDGDLSKPQGIACSSTGILYVANTGNKRIDAYNAQGLYQFSGGEKGKGSGQMESPVSVAWDKKRLYVADPGNHKVLALNTSGGWLTDFGNMLGADTLVDPEQVLVDKEGYVFVLDSARDRMVMFTPEDQLLGAFGSPGTAEGFLNHPRSFALTDTDDLYMAEDGGRVQRFHVAVRPPTPTEVSAVASEGYVTIQWEAVHTRFPASYVVYRSTPGAEPEKIKETSDTKIVDESLTADTTCVYTIVAQSSDGTLGAPSSPIAVMAHAVRKPPIEIVSGQIDDVFSADYKSYGATPFGHVVIRNNAPASVSAIKVSFDVTEYMDFPTETTVPELAADHARDVPVTATFNNKILKVSETTPIQAELKVSYFINGQETSVFKRLPFKLFSRNSIRWDHKERLAAFVTPDDPPLLDFARGITIPFLEAHQGAPLPSPVVNAWAVFSGLGVYGIHYLERPNNPYDRVSLDSNTVDSLQFARETLARKSGDCADMVALLSSALESVTVTTVALDAPGHLFMMMDTGVSDLKKLGFPSDAVVFYAGTYWIPLEATMIGSPFTDAWKRGAEEYHRWSEKGQLGIVDIHLAWAMYEPVTLPETTEHAAVPTRDALETASLLDWKSMVEWRWRSRLAIAQSESAASPGTGNPWIDMGVLAVEYHRYDEARQFFTRAKADPKTAAAAANNLGNLAYLRGDTPGAEAAYEAARAQDPKDPQIDLNLTRVYLKSKQPTKAAEAYNRAISLNASLKDQFPGVSSLEP